MLLRKSRLGSRGRAEQSRAAILQAAVREFSREGVAGARIDAIARRAHVNKALLYYYFKDKEALYSAVLDQAVSAASPTAVQHGFRLDHCLPAKRFSPMSAPTSITLPAIPTIRALCSGAMMSAGQQRDPAAA